MASQSAAIAKKRSFADDARSEVVMARINALKASRMLRLLEFVLVLVALGIGAAAVIITDLQVRGELTGNLFVAGSAFALAVLVLHFVLRWIAPQADPLILPLAVFLNSIGIALIYRIDLGTGDPIGFSSASVRQLVWAVLAVVLAGLTLVLLKNHRVLLRYTCIFGIVAIVLMLLPLVPGLGLEVGGAKQWISIGPLVFQPVELAKIGLTVFFAGYLMRNRDALSIVGKKIGPVLLPRARDLGPLFVIWAIAMGVLVFQRELGTSVLIFGLFLAVLYVATGRISWVILGVSLFVLGGVIAARTLSYVGERFENWLDPFRDAQGASYQLVQGLFGMANGGITGAGLGAGYPGLTPLSRSDYIVPSIAEELGLVGVAFVLLGYLLLVSRGMRISFAGQDDFGKLLALGLSFTIALQVFVVVGGVTRVIPLTGLTTPFLAAGGSSLMANWIIVALLMLMSNSVRNRPKLVIRS
ncbi:FtsW/RodA/SpoVE family cell cycle protein [Canibacter sp. lx-72]|uniref:FtsW/RodA/SpoVE family cell cycle protein n=1 Tax=Canibacter zhuwentaonis TaxID=2837491 RepID=UPI001BDD929D|nr:FtsW/RodA/SpoVE family cell cycle protein [Canibacter zhuwentaonis]MBT1018663.1 FtsW/RodA/SpoVE family cell cycle protein [Canibacter zhuwentaonis]